MEELTTIDLDMRNEEARVSELRQWPDDLLLMFFGTLKKYKEAASVGIISTIEGQERLFDYVKKVCIEKGLISE